MSSFTVHTPALAAAALAISANAGTVGSAKSAAASAAGSAGSFGGEPIGAAFSDMCSRAQEAMEALETTMQSLSHNVAAASVGYLVTDQGVVPTKMMPGFKA
jgi:uncharacterized protein YukE